MTAGLNGLKGSFQPKGLRILWCKGTEIYTWQKKHITHIPHTQGTKEAPDTAVRCHPAWHALHVKFQAQTHQMNRCYVISSLIYQLPLQRCT